MSENRVLFPCEKAVVLNALYDALDAIAFALEKSDSVRGTLFVSSASLPKLGGRVEVSPTLTGEQTLVEVFTDTDGEKQDEWVAALMDETQSLIKRAGMEVIK